jgi:ketosteroid isomerase-like protein
MKDLAMSKPNPTERARALVKAFYDGGARGEITSFAASLSEDFQLFVPPQLPWGGTFDKQQYIDLLPRVASTLDFAGMTYLSLTAEGEHVVALIEIGLQGTDTAVIISEHWDVRDGKAVRLRVAYFDPTPLLRQTAA